MSLRKNYNKSLLGSDWIFALVFQANTKSDKYIFMVVMSLCAHNTHTKPNKPPFIVLRGNLTTPWELVWYFVSSKWAEVFSQSCEQFKGINEFSGRREELSWQWEKRHTAEFWEIEPSEVWWFSQIQAGASLFFFFFFCLYCLLETDLALHVHLKSSLYLTSLIFSKQMEWKSSYKRYDTLL